LFEPFRETGVVGAATKAKTLRVIATGVTSPLPLVLGHPADKRAQRGGSGDVRWE